MIEIPQQAYQRTKTRWSNRSKSKIQRHFQLSMLLSTSWWITIISKLFNSLFETREKPKTCEKTCETCQNHVKPVKKKIM